MTTFSAIEFDPANGSFRVTADNGTKVFDSRYETQRIFMTGSADVPGRKYTGTNVVLDPGISTVLFGRSFDQYPYVLSAGRKLTNINSTPDDQVNIRPPHIWWNSRSTDDLSVMNGFLTSSISDRLRIVNYNYAFNSAGPLLDWGITRVWYAIFHNPI